MPFPEVRESQQMQLRIALDLSLFRFSSVYALLRRAIRFIFLSGFRLCRLPNRRRCLLVTSLTRVRGGLSAKARCFPLSSSHSVSGRCQRCITPQVELHLRTERTIDHLKERLVHIHR